MGVKKLKARINYRSKRTIIIISIAVVLLIAAIAGTVAFVKGNRDSAAAMTDDNPVTSQNDGTNAGLPNNGDQNNGSDQNNDGTTLPTDGDNTNPADSNNNDNNGSTTNDGTTGTMVPMDLQLGQQMEQTQALMLEQQQELQQQVTMVQTFQTKITHKQQQL